MASFRGKTNRWTFVIWSESCNLHLLIQWLTHQHFAAVISPEHNDDYWEAADVSQYIQTNNKRFGVVIDPDAEYWHRPTGKRDVNGIETLEHVSGKLKAIAFERVKVPKVGQQKKPHRHILLKYDYSVPYSQVLSDFEDAPCRIEYFQPVKSERALLRYFCHLDSKDKTLYDRKDVISLGGYDLAPLYELTKQDIVERCNDIMDLHGKYPQMGIAKMAQAFYNEGNWEAFSELRGNSHFWQNVLFVKDSKTGDYKAV